jgi:hypothetical protein
MSLRNPVTTKVGGAGVVGRRAAADAYLEGTSSVFALALAWERRISSPSPAPRRADFFPMDSHEHCLADC